MQNNLPREIFEKRLICQNQSPQTTEKNLCENVSP